MLSGLLYVLLSVSPADSQPAAATPVVRERHPRLPRALTREEQRMLQQGYRWGWELDGPYSSRRWGDGLYWPDDAGEEPGYVDVGGF